MRISRRSMILGVSAGMLPLPVARAGDAGTVLKIGVGTSLVQLDPLMTNIGEEYVYDNLVFNGLTRMTEAQTLEPDLAESWSFTDDLKTWTFSLRAGVQFHDGSEFSSADVVALFQRLMDPKIAAPSASNFNMLSEVRDPDARTVIFELSFPYSAFAELLSDRQIKMVPREKSAQLSVAPVGTGPFQFVSYIPGDRLILSRNPRYFEAGLPKLAGVELHIIPEMAGKIAALRSGTIDVIWDLPLDQVKALAGDPAIKVESVPSGAWDAAAMNNAVPPFDNAKVRLAFQMAVSKKDLVELTLFGQGVPTITTIPPSHPFFASDLSIAPPDIRAAKKLLAEAGYPNGLKIPVVVPVGRPVRERLGVTLQQLMKPAGFDLEIQRVPYSKYAAEVVGKVPLCINGFFERPTIDASTYPFLHSQGAWNATLWHYSDPAVDEALTAARLSGDKSVQRQKYVEMQEAFYKNPACLFAYSVNFACAYRAGISGLKTHPLRWFDLRNASISGF